MCKVTHTIIIIMINVIPDHICKVIPLQYLHELLPLIQLLWFVLNTVMYYVNV